MKYIKTIQAIDISKLFDFYDHKTNIISPLTSRKPFLSLLQYWLLFVLTWFFVSTKRIAQSAFHCFLFNFELLWQYIFKSGEIGPQKIYCKLA